MRILLAICLLVLATLAPWYVAMIGALFYALYLPLALELIIFGMMIDAYYGVLTPYPLYTLGAMVVLIIGRWAKPYFSFYNSH